MVESDAPCPLREREVTLHAAGDLLGHLRRGQGGALFISGEAGLGKTTVLDEVCRRAAVHVRVGFGRGDRMETSLPFGLLEQALDGLGARDRLMPAEAGYALGDARAARFLAVLRWLEATAAEQPVLIALDDLHWADEDSLSLLSFLCRRLSPSPVAVLGSLRPWPPSAATMSASLAEAGLAAVEHLPPLSAQAADALLRERAGRDLPADVTGRAWRVCAGNPLLLEQVAAALARGNQVPEGAGEEWAQRADGLLLWRFAGLDDAGMRCARAASVLGTRFRGQLAVDVADLGSTDADRALDALCRSRLVRPASTDSMEFVHPLFSQALYDDLPAPVRARLHARAFRLLVRQGRTADAAEHAVRGDLAGDHEAVAVLEHCGRTAVATGALSTGARWLEAAVDCAGDGADPALLVALADALLAGGRVDDAVRLCERLLLRTSVAPQLRGDALRLLGRALYFRGTHVRARECFEEAVALLASDHVEAAVQALLDLARQSWRTAGLAAALPITVRARDLARDAGEATRRRAEVAWGYLAYLSGDAAGIDPVARAATRLAVNPLSDVGDLCWTWGALRNYGNIAKYAERFEEAERTLTVALAVAEQVGAVGAAASLASNLAETLLRQGRLGEAYTLIARVGALTDLVPWIEPFVCAGHATILLSMGRLEEASDWCERGEAGAPGGDDKLALLWLWHVRGQLHLCRGRSEPASELYARVEETSRSLGIGEPCMVPWARHAVTAHATCGRDRDAARVIEWLDGCAQNVTCRWPRVAAEAGRARLAEQRGRSGDAERHWQTALALHREFDLPLDRVEVLLDYGILLRRGGRPVLAREVLAEALDTAGSVGARWLERRAREELAVAGGRRRSRRDDPDELSPQEHRVARLAVAGRSAEEMARTLCVSVNTIQSHMKRIHAKLGVHSRRQLMAMAGDDRLQDPSVGAGTRRSGSSGGPRP